MWSSLLPNKALSYKAGAGAAGARPSPPDSVLPRPGLQGPGAELPLGGRLMTHPFSLEVSLLRTQSRGWLKLGHHTALEAAKWAPGSMKQSSDCTCAKLSVAAGKILETRVGHEGRKRLALLEELLASFHSWDWGETSIRVQNNQIWPKRDTHPSILLPNCGNVVTVYDPVRGPFRGTAAAGAHLVLKSLGSTLISPLCLPTLLQIISGLRFPGPQTFFE